ncbi:MAG: hypothetical protein ACXWC5_30680 [Burkholderiales bacterium]
MLDGTHSPKRIWEIARNEWGFRTLKHKRIGGMPIALCAIYRILNSPFYAGILVWEGRTYKHTCRSSPLRSSSACRCSSTRRKNRVHTTAGSPSRGSSAAGSADSW